MDKSEIVDLMNQITFFDDFRQQDKEKLAALEEGLVEYNPGDFIIRQGDLDQTIFVLIKGKVTINKNDAPNSELNCLEPGAVFGEVPLITGAPRSTNAIAKTYVFALKLDGKLFHELDPAILNKFKDHLLKLLIRRLNEMNAALGRIKRDFQDQKDSFNKVKDEIDKILVASQNIKANKEMFSGFLDDIRG